MRSVELTTPDKSQGPGHRKRTGAFVALCLAFLTLIVYWGVQQHEFLVWDDYEYVVENPHVRTGLSVENVIWAFTSAHAGNWHPLTWLSHMLDSTLYGLNPAGHHLNNLILHLINTILLFVLFERMTGALWQSGFIAAIFAIHPLHVESVAWVAERKDLLSTLFFLLACLAYFRYVRYSSLGSYFLCIGFFVLGLASKPMVVTLPLVLLLMDYWPLHRTGFQTVADCGRSASSVSKLVMEKWPFFGLAAISVIITILAAHKGLAMAHGESLPLFQRVSNGLTSYVAYLFKTLWPSDLAFFYPHPLGNLPAWKVVGATLLLVSISVFAFMMRRTRPYLLMGWLWFLITLLPVIGLIQVGSQARADRYTYVPLIGIYIMLAWGATHAFMGRMFRSIATGFGAVIILLLSMQSSFELRHWRNGETLFQRALQVTTGNYTAHYQLGNEYMRQGKVESAIHHFSEAVRVRPDHFLAHNNLGVALVSQNRFEDALSHFMAALEVQPKHLDILSNTGDANLRLGNLEQAISFYSEALRLDPSLWRVHNDIGFAYLTKGLAGKAKLHFEEALRLNPGDRKATHNLDMALRKIKARNGGQREMESADKSP